MKFWEVLSEIIINAAIAQGFIVAFLFRGKVSGIAHLLLSILLIDISLIIFRVHYLMYPLFDLLGSHFFITGPFMLLLGPFLYFYLRSIVQPETGITRKDFPHFLVFLVYTLLMVSIAIAGLDSEYYKLVIMAIGSPWLFLVIQFVYYLVKTNRLAKEHRVNIVQRFSNIAEMDASWLKWSLWLFVLILAYITIAVPSLIHSVGFQVYKTTSAIFFSLILFFIAYKGIRQRVPAELEYRSDNGNGSRPDESLDRDRERLVTYIQQSRPYLKPELTLTELAKELDMSRNHLSHVINSGMGDNFYNLINSYRVEEVKRLIDADEKRQYKIMSLAEEAGFHSKSSFNKIFKELTGLTPSEYRERHV